ncbi:MAG: Ig-like domain-containing protein [Betaproteobacteria bacterium]|nr:Ig-like domain-containing protein [Betaproteobacteria bacterium]
MWLLPMRATLLTARFQAFLSAAWLIAVLGLQGCTAGGGDAGSTTSTTTVSSTTTTTIVGPPATVILASSAASIKADGSNTTTVTATVVDAKNLAVAGVTVAFSVKSGSGHFTTASSGTTTSSGIVTIAYSALSPSGIANQTDHTDVIQAEVSGTSVTADLVIQVAPTLPAAASSLSLLLGASAPSIRTDGSNSTTITATVIDSLRVPVAGQQISFTAPTGLLGVSSGSSGSGGAVTIPFSALAATGQADRTNRTETITANIVGTSITAQIPIQISGSTLALAASKNTAQTGESVTLTATATDAAGAGVNVQSIRFSIDSKSTGAASLGATAAVTGSNGNTSPVALNITAPGNLIINADWLNAAGSSTFTASTSIVATAAGVSFAVTAPTTNPTSLSLSASQAISVSVPSSIAGTAVANVRFATTLGTWSNAAKSITLTPAANAVADTLKAGTNSGNANIQIDALDSSGNVLATLNRVFAFSAATGTKISLQPSVSTIIPSGGGTTSSATLTATVRDAANNTVGNVPVLFEILNSTGSGEQISPVIAYTNSSGQAVANFTAGSQSTVGGLKVKASVLGSAANCDNSVTPAIAGICDVKSMFVNSTGVSVSLGQGSVLSSVNNDTNYQLPMSVLVVDNAGASVTNVIVTLSAFPTQYYKGTRNASTCSPSYASGYPKLNEDTNENDNLESGEDANGDGMITPPHAAAGSLPSTVTTDANGVATFSLTYQKQYASWVQTRIRAKVVISTGTSESINELKFILPYSLSDADSTGCHLSNSPGGW